MPPSGSDTGTGDNSGEKDGSTGAPGAEVNSDNTVLIIAIAAASALAVAVVIVLLILKKKRRG